MSEVKRVNIDFSGLQGPAKCGQCGSTTADICNQNGCGFLESGNGESELDAQRLRADTPAVERQPKGAILRFREYVGKGQGGRDLWHDWTEWSTGTVEYAKSKLDQTKDLTHIQFEVEWLYSDTPEVTALQSTIDRLESRIAQLESKGK